MSGSFEGWDVGACAPGNTEKKKARGARRRQAADRRAISVVFMVFSCVG
jgi:hypothetical protein